MLADGSEEYGLQCGTDSKCNVLYIGCRDVQVAGIKIGFWHGDTTAKKDGGGRIINSHFLANCISNCDIVTADKGA